MHYECKLLDFKVQDILTTDEEEENKIKEFTIQMFGINEKGESFMIQIPDYHPHFYIKVGTHWTEAIKMEFVYVLNSQLNEKFESIIECKLIKKKKLYGFDGEKEHNFVFVSFANIRSFNKIKSLFYTPYRDGERKLLENGYKFANTNCMLYESEIPPLLRFFHEKEINPAGWIKIDNVTKMAQKISTCTYEFIVSKKNIEALNEKNTSVPYKICSFDIEASSSHGDFPIPKKTYKYLANNIFEKIEKHQESLEDYLKESILSAFGFKTLSHIKCVYTKTKFDENHINTCIENIMNYKINSYDDVKEEEVDTLFSYMKSLRSYEDDEEEYEFKSTKKKRKSNIISILENTKIEKSEKIEMLDKILTLKLPSLEGDKVTFIGSTFLNYGEKKPYLNHCIVLNSCEPIENGENSEIETYDTEKKVLCAWTKLIRKENPDIIIGYNIFGFDYQFMFIRSKENYCTDEFLQLSRIKNQVCAEYDKEGRAKIKNSSIVIASGQHDLNFIEMTGRLQIDLYNYFRRDFSLTSYKLDYVSGYFIGDNIKKIENKNGQSICYSKNLLGLYVGSFIHIEEIGHSTEYYKNGDKFKVIEMGKDYFILDNEESPDFSKEVRWCLAKDDVTPQDIFRLTKGSAKDRSIIAKYCIQDCNLVHELLNKIDVVTGFIEMSNICSVPINFLIMRGQGIKLTSFISKKCREKETLMPTIQKKEFDDGYEGAIVLDPKCNLYLEDPVACVDYGSLYPSSMISENLCHSSKVWTKEYDLFGELIEECCETGNIYDNMENYKYVDITYDTYSYVRKTPTSAAEKIKKGYKICRFAQYPEGKRAILPSVLEQLLKSRKETKKLMAKETDPFMKNILDKRQLSIKLTANSLYGQCGARTSSFYEKDVAASTTATGRKLLTYGKRIIEEVYGDTICETKKFGKVRTNAEYVYGDTDSVFFTFNLKDPETNQPIKGKKALEITIDLAQEAGEIASKFLKQPHDLEYEKTFLPFCLLSKKRYVGMLYELDPNKCKRKSMGIVLKRRDNAPIVKDVYGGIIDILMKEQNIENACEFLKKSLQDIVDEKSYMDKLIITKSLRGSYKNPNQIAHKVLAERMGERDPGNKPSVGDRIPFVYIINPNKKALQGDKIEHPDYVKNKKIKIDYSHYITNQIMKPVLQVFSLVLEKMKEFKKKPFKLRKYKEEIRSAMGNIEDHDKALKKCEQIRNKWVQGILFDEYIRICTHSKNQTKNIQSYFQAK